MVGAFEVTPCCDALGASLASNPQALRALAITTVRDFPPENDTVEIALPNSYLSEIF